jgi:hypothetical protein
MLTAYCLSYGNWTVIPRQWRSSFSEMRDCGFDAVALSFSESEMMYSRRTFENQVKTAHDCGLKVLVIPSRLGGILAGAPYMASMWLVQNPQAQMASHPWIARVESEDFQEWIKQFITTLVSDYELDGIIWDEPKIPSALNENDLTYRPMEDSLADLLGDLSEIAKNIRPEMSITIFNMPKSSTYFSNKVAGMKAVDYAGFDGNFSRQSFFHEEPKKIKHSLSDSWSRTVSECAANDCRTFALIENMLMPESVHEEFRNGLSEFLANVHPDHLGAYYYAHNNECPEEVHKMTLDIIKKYYLN